MDAREYGMVLRELECGKARLCELPAFISAEQVVGIWQALRRDRTITALHWGFNERHMEFAAVRALYYEGGAPEAPDTNAAAVQLGLVLQARDTGIKRVYMDNIQLGGTGFAGLIAGIREGGITHLRFGSMPRVEFENGQLEATMTRPVFHEMSVLTHAHISCAFLPPDGATDYTFLSSCFAGIPSLVHLTSSS